MNLLKKTAPARADNPAAPFVMPTLEENSEAYSALLEKRQQLLGIRGERTTEERKLRREIEADTAPSLRPAIANLLGDDEDSKPHLTKRMAEISREIQDIDIALGVLRERIGAERTKASLKVAAASKPEYARRVAVLGKALRAVQSARADYDTLVDQFNANDIAWASLIPLQPNFLGDPRDGHIQRWFQAVKEAGYDIA